MKTTTLNLIAHHFDNGDGSTSVRLFNNRKELEENLKKNGNKFSVEDIENGEDTYEHGTLTEHSIALEIDPATGLAKLSRSVTMTSN